MRKPPARVFVLTECRPGESPLVCAVFADHRAAFAWETRLVNATPDLIVTVEEFEVLPEVPRA